MQVTIETPASLVPANKLAIGQMGVVESNSPYQGHVFIMSFLGILDLTNPRHGWAVDVWPEDTLMVTILPEGSTVTLEV